MADNERKYIIEEKKSGCANEYSVVAFLFKYIGVEKKLTQSVYMQYIAVLNLYTCSLCKIYLINVADIYYCFWTNVVTYLVSVAFWEQEV